MKATIFFILYSMFIVSYVGAGISGSKMDGNILKEGDIVGARLIKTFNIGIGDVRTRQEKEITYKVVKQDNVSPFPGLFIHKRYTPKHEDYEMYMKQVKPESNIDEDQLKENDVVAAKVSKTLNIGVGDVRTYQESEETYKLVKQDKISPFPALKILKHFTPEHEDYEKYKKRVKPESDIGIMTLRRTNSA